MCKTKKILPLLACGSSFLNFMTTIFFEVSYIFHKSAVNLQSRISNRSFRAHPTTLRYGFCYKLAYEYGKHLSYSVFKNEKCHPRQRDFVQHSWYLQQSCLRYLVFVLDSTLFYDIWLLEVKLENLFVNACAKSLKPCCSSFSRTFQLCVNVYYV